MSEISSRLDPALRAEISAVDGEWNNEPDRVEWRDAETNLPCIALRHPSWGHWCGYVGVGPAHAWYRKDYMKDDVNITVHGGLSFAEACQPASMGEHRVCHTPLPGESDHEWWFGFDCAHSGDMGPRDLSQGYYRDGIYRNLAFVRDQCAGLAMQLAAIQ